MKNLPVNVINKIQKTKTCWIWTGCLVLGYGHVSVNGRQQKAHRVVFEHYKGKIPNGLQIDHLCRKTSCVNPKHLRAVTAKENVLCSNNMAAKNALKIKCKNGHEFSRLNKAGARICTICKKDYQNNYRKSHDRSEEIKKAKIRRLENR